MAVMVLHILDFLTLNNVNEKIMIAAIQVVFSASSFTIYLLSRVNYNFKQTSFNGLAVIIESSTSCGFDTLFDNKTATCYIKRSYLMAILSISSVVLFLTLNQEFHTHLVVLILKIFALGVDIIFQSILFWQNLLELAIYHTMFKRSFDNLRNVLLPEHKDINVESEIAQYSKVDSLKRINNVYMSLLWNYRHSLAFLQPTVVFIWIMMVALLICQFYILLLVYDGEIKGDPMLVIRSFLSVFPVVVNLIATEKLNNTVSSLVCTFDVLSKL